MSVHQSTSSLARARSLRVPAKLQTASHNSSAANASATAVPSSTSNLSLFLTNLRLLDLDCHPEWPGITTVTFSTKDVGQGQKKRIQCVEWALFQLFAIWDPEETRNKLKPFFPPLDQVQSLNLRSALTRCLEAAKKNGVLGRDAVIRKTMLDECKGGRLEEVLAVFSSAVLKKVAAEAALNGQSTTYPSVAETIALENWGYSGNRTELNGLLIAHKAALSKFLRDKNSTRDQYRDFAELLALKQRSIARRREQAKAARNDDPEGEIPEDVHYRVSKTLRNNWSGNEQWVEVLLKGGAATQKDGLLSSPFDAVWRSVSEGRLSELEDQHSGSLLDKLDGRVRLQKDRLAKWDGYRKKMFGDKPNTSTNSESEPQTKAKAINLDFTRHQRITLDSVDLSKEENKNWTPNSSAPMSIIESMTAELEAIGKPRMLDISALRALTHSHNTRSGNQAFLNVAMPSAEPISDLSEWEDEPEEEPVEETRPNKPDVKQLRSRINKVAATQPRSNNTSSQNLKVPTSKDRELDLVTDVSDEDRAPGVPLKPIRQHEDCIQIAQDRPVSSPSPEIKPVYSYTPKATVQLPHHGQERSPSPPASPTQAMADEILASMNNASPSPTKKPRHTLSLSDRTRMSMTRTKSFDPDDEPEVLSTKRLHAKRSTQDQETSLNPDATTEVGSEHEDLIARTRRSMAGFEAARQKAQLERRRSARKSKMIARKESLFPKVEEEELDNGDTSILADELMEGGQDDYEAVFRSRPRMRTSPLPSPSPQRRWDDEGYE